MFQTSPSNLKLLQILNLIQRLLLWHHTSLRLLRRSRRPTRLRSLLNLVALFILLFWLSSLGISVLVVFVVIFTWGSGAVFVIVGGFEGRAVGDFFGGGSLALFCGARCGRVVC